MSATNGPTCGDLGGKGRKGRPCRRAAGWATQHAGEGRCRNHDEASQGAREAKKVLFLKALGDAAKTWIGAAEEAGISRRTLYEWTEDDAVFKEQAQALRKAQRKQRVELWEDRVFQRIMKGETSAALEIFWVVNISDGEWKNVQDVRHEVDVGSGVVLVPSAVEPENWAKAARLQQNRLVVSAASDNGRSGRRG